MLTRTTLETDQDLSALAIADLIGALRHVPGVLLADVADGSCRAVVAHDVAVPRASLLAAAEGAGVHARIRIDEGPVPEIAAGVTAVAAAPVAANNRLLTILAEVALLFALIYVIDPRLMGVPSFVALALASVLGCVIARAVFGLRK